MGFRVMRMWREVPAYLVRLRASLAPQSQSAPSPPRARLPRPPDVDTFMQDGQKLEQRGAVGRFRFRRATCKSEKTGREVEASLVFGSRTMIT